MKEIEYQARVKAAQNMIDKARKRKRTAIEYKNWLRAAEVDAIIEGMEQILILFQMPERKEAQNGH
jgi:hypothetical protein